MDQGASKLPRLQFTIARLLACTTLVALAAWMATVELPMTVHVGPFGKRNLLPFIVVSLLLAAAVGVLIKGKPGAMYGVQVGCGVMIAAAAMLPVFVLLAELFQWIARRL